MLALRLKLTAGLLLLMVVVASAYAFLTGSAFAERQTAATLDAQQKQITALTFGLRRSVDRAVLDLKTAGFLATLGETGRVKEVTEIFARNGHLAAMGGWSEPGGTVIFSKEQTPGLLARIPPAPREANGTSRDLVMSLGDNLFAVSTWMANQQQDLISLRGAFKMDVLAGPADGEQTFFLTDERRVVAQRGLIQAPADGVIALSTEDYLISQGETVAGRLAIWAATPRSRLFSPMQFLSRKTFAFLGFAALVAFLAAFALASLVTGRKEYLQAFSGKAGRGEFTVGTGNFGRDEMTSLAGAVGAMMHDVQNLLHQDSDREEKTQREAEMKTVRRLRENLFPARSEFQEGLLRVHGFRDAVRGDDWWSHSQRGDEITLVITQTADDGAGSALMTAAARTVFAMLQTRDLPLHEAAAMLDTAIAQTGAGRASMSAYLVRVNTVSGLSTALNAGHVDAVMLTPDKQGVEAALLRAPKGSRLGEGKGIWSEFPFVLEPGQRLILRTETGADDVTLTRFEKLIPGQPVAEGNSLVILENTKRRG